MKNKGKKNDILSTESVKSQKLRVLKDKCSYLYQTKQPFTLVKSGSTYELMSRLWNEKAFRTGFKPEDLQFIRSVRSYVDKRAIAVNFVDKDYKGSGIDYIKVNRHKPGEIVEDLVYIDINSAYWQTAFNLGVISHDLFLRGQEVDKVVRLAALGSLAKSKSIWDFDGKEFKHSDGESQPTENVWFAICKRVSDVMVNLSKKVGGSFVFYWVDGIYVKNDGKSMGLIIEELIKEGYTSKCCKIPFVQFNEKGFTVQGAVKSDIKEFSWDVSGKRGGNKPITEYIENQRLLAMAHEIMYRK